MMATLRQATIGLPRISAAVCASLAFTAAAMAEDTPATRPHVAPPPAVEAGAATSYIGVATSAAPAALREQLRLPKGVGLVVEFVERDSPAEAAGLQPHDVIQKFNDQILVNAQQLSVLVRLCSPGEKVTLSVIRGGERRDLNATLGGRRSIAAPQAPFAASPQDDDAPLPRPGVGRSSHVIKNVDAEHEIVIVTHEGESTATIKDHGGALLYRGRVDRAEDLAKLPEAVRNKVIDMQKKSAALRRMPQAAPDDDL